MNSTSITRVFSISKLSRRFALITAMFLSVLLGTMVFTATIISKEKSNAILIDMAGRQHMLFQKHMNEILLTSQGVTADYTSTRELLRSTLQALMEGGSVILDPETGERQTIPAAPTEGILIKLRDQWNHFDQLIELADVFLLLSPDHPEFHRKLQDLRARNSALIGIANDVVKQLDMHAESNIMTMVKWETIVAFFVGLFVFYVTSQGLQTGRKLENEIAERNRAEANLRANEQMYRQILDSISDMVFVKDRNLRMFWANKAFRDYYNMTNDELKGILDSKFNKPEFTKQYNEADAHVLNTGNFVEIHEEPVTRHDGQVHLFHTIKTPLFGENGEVVKLVGVARNITERKQSEELARKGERKFRAIYEQAPTGIATLDSLSGQFTQINQKYCDITGYSQAEMLDRTFQDLTYPDDLQADMENMQLLLAGQVKTFQMEKRYIQKNGEVIWVNLTCVPLWLEPTDARQHIAMVQDINHRKKGEKALQESEERYRVLYEDNPSMYFTVTQDGRILSVNKFGALQLGYLVEELIGKPVIEVFFEDDKPLVQQNFTICLQDTSRVFHWELRKTRKDGSVLWVREAARTIQAEDGEKVVLIVCEDITERKQTEDRLRESEMKRTEALRQSDELKSALLTSVSHELRTPLTAMKASVSSILGNGPSDMNEVHLEFLEGVDKEINYMSRLIDNLLDMSQIEARALIPHREWHPLEDLVEGALRRVELNLKSRSIEIHIPEDVPPVFVDAVKMQQVLINLLDNAVKYSSTDSSIQIHVRVGDQEIEVEVSNTGENIQGQDLERIFERFYRRRLPHERTIRGTGLGLAICKGIIEVHGGRIWAESLGKVVTITFTVPRAKSMASFSLEGLQKG